MSKNRIAETLKRHNQLLEYSFVTGLTEVDEEPGVDPAVDPTEEPPADAGFGVEAPPADAGFGAEAPPADAGFGAEAPPDATGFDTGNGISDEEVVVDVSDLVTQTQDISTSVTDSSTKIDDLLNKFADLESKIGEIDVILSKIDDLDHEIKERNPTPVEKLDMISLQSYPYNIKLSDFWADKGDNYSVEPEEETETEYTLTKDDIEDDYDPNIIKKTFNPEDENKESKFGNLDKFF